MFTMVLIGTWAMLPYCNDGRGCAVVFTLILMKIVVVMKTNGMEV